ncbi:hypothetical protein AB0H37_35145 [Actinomadura sp. NPDC023710]|uniref:TRADD-N-associated membrane domain-containing protein n=1 Tax=Actinomadura sp. NPDC023710 TaxID=3158219 RepID=UPI003407C410
MQLPRAVIGAVFVVIGALIAMPAIGHDYSTREKWIVAIFAASVLLLVSFDSFFGEERPKKPEKDVEAERLRRAAGLPPTRSDEEITRRQEKALRRDMQRLEKALEDIQEEKKKDGDVSEEIALLKEGLSEIRGRLGRNQSEEELLLDDHRPGWATLVEVYIQATRHLGSSYRIGQSFAVSGGLLFLFGVGLALFRPHGNQTAAILAAVGGSITNITSGVFFAQTNRARDYLERQAKSLREDILIREFVKQSEEVIASVDDVARRDELRAQVVLRILGGANAELIAPDKFPETRQSLMGRLRWPFRAS